VAPGTGDRRGKLDAKKAIDAAVLLKAGVIRRVKDGVKLLGEGELKSKLNLTVYSRHRLGPRAVEKAGGKLTTTQAGSRRRARRLTC
jgi:large subunit ribosomal protein L15